MNNPIKTYFTILYLPFTNAYQYIHNIVHNRSVPADVTDLQQATKAVSLSSLCIPSDRHRLFIFLSHIWGKSRRSRCLLLIHLKFHYELSCAPKYIFFIRTIAIVKKLSIYMEFRRSLIYGESTPNARGDGWHVQSYFVSIWALYRPYNAETREGVGLTIKPLDGPVEPNAASHVRAQTRQTRQRRKWLWRGIRRANRTQPIL
ncbi:hypothetical protein QTP88_008895 [Uroleucon formosanum]